MGCFRLFTALYFTLDMHLKKNPLNFFLLKVTKFHGDSVKTESARTKPTYRGGGALNDPPPTRLFMAKTVYFLSLFLDLKDLSFLSYF